MYTDTPELHIDNPLGASFADLPELRRNFWIELISSTRIPSLFAGKSRGLENLESSSFQNILGRIQRDPLLRTKLLSVANSSRTGQREPVRSLDGACQQLGRDLVLAIVLVYEMENELHDEAQISRKVIQHVRGMASLSHALGVIYARELKLADPEDFVNAALLSAMAALLLAHTAQFDTQLYLGFPDELQRLQYEYDVWGICSPPLSQHMVELWGLQYPIPGLVGKRHLPLIKTLDPQMPTNLARQLCLLAAINALSQAYIHKQSITPEILFNRRNYTVLKQNLLQLGLYVPIGRHWGKRSTDLILRAAW